MLTLAHFTPAELPGSAALFLLGAWTTALCLGRTECFGHRLYRLYGGLCVITGLTLLLTVMADPLGLSLPVRLAVDAVLLAGALGLLRMAVLNPGPDSLSRLLRRSAPLSVAQVGTHVDSGPDFDWPRRGTIAHTDLHGRLEPEDRVDPTPGPDVMKQVADVLATERSRAAEIRRSSMFPGL
jgi:hypothetical protein